MGKSIRTKLVVYSTCGVYFCLSVIVVGMLNALGAPWWVYAFGLGILAIVTAGYK